MANATIIERILGPPAQEEDTMDISGKVANRPPAARSGLGQATVRKLALEGAKAVILDLPSSEGKKVAEELGAGRSLRRGRPSTDAGQGPGGC